MLLKNAFYIFLLFIDLLMKLLEFVGRYGYSSILCLNYKLVVAGESKMSISYLAPYIL